MDTAPARVVSVFGEARVHHAYLFMNRRSNRIFGVHVLSVSMIQRLATSGSFAISDNSEGSFRASLTELASRLMLYDLSAQMPLRSGSPSGSAGIQRTKQL